MDVLTDEAVKARLPTRWLGQTAYVFDAIPSTNTWLMQEAGQGAAEGALALADVQTAGRGRLGRTWQSPPGAGLLFSLLFRPRPPITPAQIMMVVGVGVARGIEGLLHLTPRLKWPNDVLLNGRKLAGILGESSGLTAGVGEGSGIRGRRSASGGLYVVVGCGINVNLASADFPPTPPGGLAPTSLLAELGHPVPRIHLLHAILAEIETRYDALQVGQSPHTEWRSLCATLGQAVRVTGGGATVEGVAEDVAEDGSLLVRQADGTLVTVAAGDVSLRAGVKE